MAAYAALARMDYDIQGFLDYSALFQSCAPVLQEMYETAHKKIKSFQVFMERLDLSSRIKMKDSFQRVEQAVDLFFEAISSFAEKGKPFAEFCLQDKKIEEMDEQSVELLDKLAGEYERYLEDLRQVSLSFIDTLEKMEQEYLKQDSPLPVDEDIHSKSKMFGLSDEYTKLKKEIIIGSCMNLFIHSLVGMAGIGKTTLANKLFEDFDVLEWFGCCAWVTVGREYQLEEIVQDILTQLGVDEHDMLTEGYLNEYLKNNRCFIVLDDVWDMELVQNCLKTSSPITFDSASQILVTTRIQHPHSFGYHLINMRLLNKQESWNLLCDKVFAQNPCPVELERTGKMIAEKCDGLPLTIVTIADLLSRTPRSEWVDVATQRKHQLFTDAYDEISKVLYPSYDNLHKDLKLCFLYMAVFLPNYKIPKSKIINMWIVEKIIPKSFEKTLEIVGEGYLQEFAVHNVIMVYQRSSVVVNDIFDKIKTCGLHSSWWHLCYKEARKLNFFHILDSYTDASSEVIKRQTRLSVHNNILFGIKCVYESMEENCASTTHSLLCLGPYHQYPVPICFGLKLLKKLEALEIRFYEFPLEVLELVKLRYLALTCNASLPPSISKLWKLRYLIVRRHLIMKFGAPSYLPIEIWDMKRLKLLHVTGCDLPDVSDTFLPNLLKLSDVSFHSCTTGVVGRIPNIKKLGIRIDRMPAAVELLCCFDHVSHLSELESLKCVIVNPTCNFEVVAPLSQLSMFPFGLKKLTLSGLGYPWKEMSTISSLPNLEVLKLRNNAFQGPLWEVENDKFPKLYFLQLEDIDLEILEGEDSFKCLKKLTIKHCYNLKKLHFTMRYEFLSNLEVIDCNPRIEKNIQKRVLKTGGGRRSLVQFSFSWNT